MEDKRNLKNIYLVGPSRCGKTTTASMLGKKLGYTHIIMDAVIETMSEVAPELGIRHGNLESESFRNFLISYSKNLFKYTKHNVIDLEKLSPDVAKQIIDEDESIVIYMGYPQVTPDEKLQQIREYDTLFDWTRNLSDEELIEILSAHIKTSKKLQEEAEKYGFPFIDTSFDRDANIIQRIDEIEKSGILDRTGKSYEKYYRWNIRGKIWI